MLSLYRHNSSPSHLVNTVTRASSSFTTYRREYTAAQSAFGISRTSTPSIPSLVPHRPWPHVNLKGWANLHVFSNTFTAARPRTSPCIVSIRSMGVDSNRTDPENGSSFRCRWRHVWSQCPRLLIDHNAGNTFLASSTFTPSSEKKGQIPRQYHVQGLLPYT